MINPNVLWAVFAVGAVSVIPRPVWRHGTTHVITTVHEFGHMVAAIACGGRPTGVRLNHDSSGLTGWAAPRGSRRIRAGLVAAAGVPAPAAVGAACVWATRAGYAQWALLGLAIMVGIVTLFIRNLWGVLVVIVLGWGCYLAWQSGDVITQVSMVGVGGLLCFGGVRGGWEEWQARRTSDSCDSRQMQAMWLLPSVVWATGMLAFSVAATGWAIWQLPR